MLTILHLDASARPAGSDVASFGSHSRRLSGRFAREWRARRPSDRILYRDIGQCPPRPVDTGWIHAAFTPSDQRAPWMDAALFESDRLVDELISADIVVAGVPMYNFGVPAQFKAYIDNVVRVGRTFGFDRAREGVPYWPMLNDKPRKLVLLSSRGDYGYGPDQRIAHMNHVEPALTTAFGYIGIDDVESIAIEYDEFSDQRLAASIAAAEQQVDQLVARLALRASDGE